MIIFALLSLRTTNSRWTWTPPRVVWRLDFFFWGTSFSKPGHQVAWCQVFDFTATLHGNSVQVLENMSPLHNNQRSVSPREFDLIQTASSQIKFFPSDTPRARLSKWKWKRNCFLTCYTSLLYCVLSVERCAAFGLPCLRLSLQVFPSDSGEFVVICRGACADLGSPEREHSRRCRQKMLSVTSRSNVIGSSHWRKSPWAQRCAPGTLESKFSAEWRDIMNKSLQLCSCQWQIQPAYRTMKGTQRRQKVFKSTRTSLNPAQKRGRVSHVSYLRQLWNYTCFSFVSEQILRNSALECQLFLFTECSKQVVNFQGKYAAVDNMLTPLQCSLPPSNAESEWSALAIDSLNTWVFVNGIHWSPGDFGTANEHHRSTRWFVWSW